MSHSALLEYIRKARGCGASDTDIAYRLQCAGWYSVDIQDALELHQKLVIPRTAVALASSAQNIPRKVSGKSIAIVAFLGFIIGLALYVWLTHY